MSINLRVWIYLFAVLLITGCALIITGPRQSIAIHSDEPGTKVFVDGKLQDTAPCTIKVRRSQNAVPEISLEKKGFQTQQVYLKRKFNEISLLNFILPVNWAVDWATGAIWKYSKPDTVHMVRKNKTR